MEPVVVASKEAWVAPVNCVVVPKEDGVEVLETPADSFAKAEAEIRGLGVSVSKPEPDAVEASIWR